MLRKTIVFIMNTTPGEIGISFSKGVDTAGYEMIFDRGLTTFLLPYP